MTKLQSEIKPKIFNPFYLNFPILDHFKIPSREEARRLAIRFKAELTDIVLSGHKHEHPEGMDSCHLGCRLVTAYETGIM